MARKKTKVEHAKLGQFQAEGLAYKDEKRIVIDKRLKGRKYLLCLIHELTHIHLPDFTEEQVVQFSERLTNDLWSLKIRRVDE